jgi:hypothetical protein
MRVNKITLIISLIGVNLLFATDISPYNLLLFLFFQIVAISYLRNKMKEQQQGYGS